MAFSDFENEVLRHFPREAGLSNIERHPSPRGLVRVRSTNGGGLRSR